MYARRRYRVTGDTRYSHSVNAELPIDEHLEKISEIIAERGSLVIVAEPGAGKTTRVPPALSDMLCSQKRGGRAKVLVSQPRRIAARLAAHRVAQELRVAVGDEVGYQVRFETRTSPKTRICFATEGVLLRQLLDGALPDVDVIILDEVHERHLQGDIALALLHQRRRHDKKAPALVLMSATLQAEDAARYLECDVYRVKGRQYPVSIDYDERPLEGSLAERIATTARRIFREEETGDVLVFLPGAAEIRRALARCRELLPQSILVEALHGSLPLAEQNAVLAPTDQRKVILSTNVAETSLTVEGVTAVIDSGLVREASHSPWSGLPTLETRPVSQASATQRAGRAGRLRPGRCIRLYGEQDLLHRRTQDVPEIQRADLAEIMLALTHHKQTRLEELELIEPPPSAAIAAARSLLQRLRFFDGRGEITALGREAARVHLHPRLARLLLEAVNRGASWRGCALAALYRERDIRAFAKVDFSHNPRQGRDEVGASDGLADLELLESVEQLGVTARTLRAHGLDVSATSAVRNEARRLRKRLHAEKPSREKLPVEAEEEALLIATLAAFPDRVARRRRPRGSTIVFAAGGSAKLAQSSVVKEGGFMVAVDVETRRRGGAIVRSASLIEPDWLIELFADDLVEDRRVAIDSKTGRVQATEALRFEDLVLDASHSFDVTDEEAEQVLMEAVRARGAENIFDLEAYQRHRARMTFAAPYLPSDEALLPPELDELLARLCRRPRSLDELASIDLVAEHIASLSGPSRAGLKGVAPLNIAIPGRQRVPINYSKDSPPWISSRLQDFFGSSQTPTIANGRAPLVLHLLAPNQRAVQVTTDLAGFWQNHYPAIRRELMRRYPKHAWPEDPLSAKPSRPGRRRGS